MSDNNKKIENLEESVLMNGREIKESLQLDSRITNLETNFSVVDQKLDDICKKLDNIPTKSELEATNTKQEMKIKKDIKDEYATKDRVQRIEKLLWFTLGGAFAGAIAYLFTEITNLI